MLSEIHELNRLRIEQDLTYGTLARQVGIKPQALYRILTVPNPKLRDRTLFKIQRFLQDQRRGTATEPQVA